MDVEAKQICCKRCGHRWYPRQADVRICPKCKSPYWDREKKLACYASAPEEAPERGIE